jgi:hypothetical protein
MFLPNVLHFCRSLCWGPFKEWVCGHWLAGIAGSNPDRWHRCLCLVSVVCCQVEVCVIGWSLCQGSHTDLLYVSLSVVLCIDHLIQRKRSDEAGKECIFLQESVILFGIFYFCKRLEQTRTNRHSEFSVNVQNRKSCVDGRTKRLSPYRKQKMVFVSFHLSF